MMPIFCRHQIFHATGRHYEKKLHTPKLRGTRRRCSAKYLFRSGNSAGWEINYFYRFQLGILHFFKHFEPSWLDFPKDWERLEEHLGRYVM